MHMAQLISDVIYCLQGSRPQDETPDEVTGVRANATGHGEVTVHRNFRHTEISKISDTQKFSSASVHELAPITTSYTSTLTTVA